MSTDQPTVADLSRARGNCRVGLAGLRMRHLPTGSEFVCRGTHWAVPASLRLEVEPARVPTREDRLRAIARRLGEGTPAYLQAVDAYDRLGLVCAADVRVSPPPGSVGADECVLLVRWPVTCCRPSRAGVRQLMGSP